MARPDGEAVAEGVNDLSEEIIAAAIHVHKELGPGLLERAYEEALAIALEARGLEASRQIDVPVVFEGAELDASYRLDLLVEDTVVVEVKTVTEVQNIHRAQLLTYLTFAEKPLGLLLNFHVPKLVDGVHRMVV